MQQPGERQLILVFLLNLLFFHNDAEHQQHLQHRQHPKGNSLSGKHWEKNGQGGGPGQGNPARPWKTHKNHLGSSSTHACRFFDLGSSAISAPPLLFVPLFLSPGTKKVVLQTCTSGTVYLSPQVQLQSQLLLEGGTSVWDAEVHVQLWGERRSTSPQHPVLSWPKPLDAMTSPLCLMLSVVRLLGVLHHPPSTCAHAGLCTGQKPHPGNRSHKDGYRQRHGTSVLLLPAVWKHLQRSSPRRRETTQRTTRAGFVVRALSGAVRRPIF